MKNLGNILKLALIMALVSLTGCVSMLTGIDKPGPQTVMVEGQNGEWFAEGVVTAVLDKEYEDNTVSENFGRGLAQGAAGMLGPIGSLAAAGSDMAYESQKVRKTFQILTVKVDNKEVQVIQPTPTSNVEGAPYLRDFEVGEKVRITANQTTPPHAIPSKL